MKKQPTSKAPSKPATGPDALIATSKEGRIRLIPKKPSRKTRPPRASG